jgi:hypothetical protein
MITKPSLVALALIAVSASAWAQITLSGVQTDDIIIPNNDLNGVAETISLNSSIQSITGVQLTLDVGGTPGYPPFNGNYYAYLEHGSTLVTLLNRVGTSPGNAFGYADMGFDVTLNDNGPDIHNYQNGPYTLNGAGQLTGTWGPDGGLLSAFDGQGSSGGWTLFIADESSGGTGNLDNWSLQVTGTTSVVTVPDGGDTMGLLFLGASSLAFWALRKRD